MVACLKAFFPTLFPNQCEIKTWIDPTNGAYFTIDAVEPYEPNENGRPTLLLSARFSGLLASEGGVVKEVAEARVVFAIAY